MYMVTVNVTVNLMALLAALCYVNTVEHPSDTIDSLQCFEEAYNSLDPITHPRCLKAEDIIVTDNVPTHHNAGGKILGEFLADLGIELVHIPAYSPDFNPVEYVWKNLHPNEVPVQRCNGTKC